MHTYIEGLRILIAPDKFKGGLSATEVASGIADAWRAVRPADTIRCIPMADGGDGTAAVVAGNVAGATWCEVTTADAVGVPGSVTYPVLPDGTAIVELAAVCGLARLERPAPLQAHTFGLGQALADATRRGAARITVALGGSASTDGGVGALMSLGGVFRDSAGNCLSPGDDLRTLAAVDMTALLPPPPDGVEVLVDTDAVLSGPSGAAYVFAPQKGADPESVKLLDAGLAHLADVIGADPTVPGTGAAGGTAFGLAALWGAQLVAGAARVAEIAGIADALANADVLITGEGRYDASSGLGKVTGFLGDLAARQGIPTVVIAGSIADGLAGVSLSEVAGSSQASLAWPSHWLTEAVRRLAALPSWSSTEAYLRRAD